MYLNVLKIIKNPSSRFFSTLNSYKTIKLTNNPKFPFLTKTPTIINNSGYYNILLDNRILLTPLGNTLYTSNLEVANLIIDEFKTNFNKLTTFNDLPYTMLLSKSIDLSLDDKINHLKTLKESINSDSVLFFEKVDFCPDELSCISDIDSLSGSSLENLRKFDLEMVQSFFFPGVLRSFSNLLNVPSLVTSSSVSKIPRQHPDTISVFESYIDSLNTFRLISTLKVLCNLKSIILSLLYLNGLITTTRCLRLSRIEETVQCSHWGLTDSFGLEERRIISELEKCSNFYKLNP
uniref:ATP12 chaperone protein, putative n=1 Tax=Theileria annulata TaxID=5874 RepID=A0A3B0N8K7_THEAN